MSAGNTAILAISVDFLKGTKALQSLLRWVQKFSKIHAISSVYKHYLNSRKEDLNSELWIAVRVTTSLRPDELVSEISLSEIFFSEETAGNQAKVLLLLYNDETIMTPRLTLPYLQLHQNYYLLVCAAEVAPSQTHPVLGKSLAELSSTFKDRSRVEFLQQASGLLT